MINIISSSLLLTLATALASLWLSPLSVYGQIENSTGAYAAISGKNGIKGNARFTKAEGSDGIKVHLHFSGLLASNMTDGFPYHLHELPVSNGSCLSAKGHFNPDGAPPDSVCSKPPDRKTCEVGDLSGRHGNIPGAVDVLTLTYTDYWLRLLDPTYGIIGRSIVVHGRNKTRLACGNIVAWDTSGPPPQEHQK